jgi:protein-tyrosine phosphatase
MSPEEQQSPEAEPAPGPDIAELRDNLFFGSCANSPPESAEGFDVVYVVATECGDDIATEGTRIVHAPIDDVPDKPMHHDQVELAVHTAQKVAQDVYNGERVLVACNQGLNRSALVAGMATILLDRVSGREVVKRVRKLRGKLALANPHFVFLLNQFAP